MTYKLFPDDERVPSQVKWVDIHVDNREWVIVRNYDAFVAYIEANGIPDLISFDHDLQGFYWEGDDLRENTGNTCAKWLIEYCRDRNLPRPKFFIHSMSVVGQRNIWNTLMGP